MNALQKRFAPWFLFLVLLALVFLPYLLLLLSWRWDWLEAWLHIVMPILAFVISHSLTSHLHPDFQVEHDRFQQAVNIKSWNKSWVA